MLKLKGIIKLEVFAEGSKSESKKPYIFLSNGGKLLLYKKNDNPFENSGFSDFIDKRVCLEGELVDEVFEVETIKNLESEELVSEGEK